MTTIASAPGKVLLTGGYLVLEQSFSGLVIATSARFYTVIQQCNDKDIHVRSPQFEAASWSYSANVGGGDELQFSTLAANSKNPFVETSLRFSLAIILQKIGLVEFRNILKRGLEISIVGDNDFYSQRRQLQAKGLPNTAESLQSVEPFSKLNGTLGNVHKTGLGSSAAMTTSLVAALFLHFKAASLDTEDGRSLVHNVAQYVHCFAQGKVGSGFDVSAAIWGSHRYQRFNPDILKSIMGENMNTLALYNALYPTDPSHRWDNKVVPFRLAPGLELVLADIDSGSHTPTLVGQVLAWRSSKPDEANALWTELGYYNVQVEERIRDLEKLHAEDQNTYLNTLAQCANTTSDTWDLKSDHPVIKQMTGLVTAFNKVRVLLRKMSALSGVGIEPEEQTRLLDACMKVSGVVMAGVPGAGGYDAIFCIVLSERAKMEVRQTWASWTELSVGPLLAKADDSQGVVEVDINAVPDLKQALSR